MNTGAVEISKPKVFFQYFQSRFPILLLFLFAFTTLFSVASVLGKQEISTVLLVTCVYVSFLFHLRVLDEFKDFGYDSTFHANRPVQKGLITFSDLISMGFVNALFMEIFVFLGLRNVAPTSQLAVTTLLILALVYTFLMFKDFFMNKEFKKRSVLYLTTHELVFIPLFFYFFSVLSGRFWVVISQSDIALFLYAIIPIILIEIGRKMQHRRDSAGKQTNDTYVFMWGEKETIQVFAGLILFSALLANYIVGVSLYRVILVAFAGCALFLGSFISKDFIMKNHMRITILCALGLPLSLIV